MSILQNKKISFSWVFALASLVVFFHPAYAFAFGISPGRVNLGSVLNSTSVKQTITVTRGNPSADQTLGLTLSGSGSKYLVLDQKTIFLKKGESLTPFTFHLAPKNAPNGDYVAIVELMGVPNPSASAGTVGSTVNVGAAATIRFTVSDKQERSGDFHDTHIDSIEAGTDNQLSVRTHIKNTGNIDLLPQKVVAQIYNANGLVVEKTIEPISIDTVEVGADDERSFGIPVSLSLGAHWANFTFFIDGKEQPKIEHISFQVLKPGSLTQKINLLSFSSSVDTLKEAGIPVQLEAMIENAGDAGWESSLYIEVKDGKDVVDTFQTPKAFLAPHGQRRISYIYTPKTTGTFVLTAFGDTGVVRSASKQINLKVGTSRVVVYGIMALVLVAIVVVTMAYLKKRKINN